MAPTTTTAASVTDPYKNAQAVDDARKKIAGLGARKYSDIVSKNPDTAEGVIQELQWVDLVTAGIVFFCIQHVSKRFKYYQSDGAEGTADSPTCCPDSQHLLLGIAALVSVPFLGSFFTWTSQCPDAQGDATQVNNLILATTSNMFVSKNAGGGMLGIGLLGFTYILEQAGIRFVGLGGTSAGAINTMLIAARRKSPDQACSLELLEILAKADFPSFLDGPEDNDSKANKEAQVMTMEGESTIICLDLMCTYGAFGADVRHAGVWKDWRGLDRISGLQYFVMTCF